MRVSLALAGLLLSWGAEAGEWRQAVLDPAARIHLAWRVQGEEITFQVEARTQGWVGIGLSPNAGMGGADIVVGGVRNGEGYLYDRHASANAWPPMDPQQDYRLIAAAENATHTRLRFARALHTCDEDDWDIGKDTVRFLWALHPQDANSQDDFQKHNAFRDRGAKSLMLLDEPTPPDSVSPSARTIELRPNNVHLPDGEDSLYWCSIYKLPMEWGPMQMVQYAPMIQSGNEQFVHHAVVYHCMEDMEDLVGTGAPCFDFNDKSYHNPMKSCSQRYIAGWAVGGGTVTFPADMGFPIMEPGTSPYLMLEMHYDNPQIVPGVVDNSGMRIWLEPRHRPIEVGNLILGLGVQPWDFLIPPGQEKFTWSSVCQAKCTEKFPSEGIKFMNLFPHAHLTGRGLRLRHIRAGVELPPIYSDDHYDFNYQEQRALKPNPTILPGDILITECDFDTRKRSSVTFASYSTRDEMCLIFADFYPREADSMVTCMGNPSPKLWGDLMGATADKDANGKDAGTISGPLGQNIEFRDYVNRFYDPDAPEFAARVAALKAAQPGADYYTVCGGRDATDDINTASAQERFFLRKKRRSEPRTRNEGRKERTKIEKMNWDFVPFKGLPRYRAYQAPQICPAGGPGGSTGPFAFGPNPQSPPVQQRQAETVDQALDPNYRPFDERYDHEAWLDNARNFRALWLLRDDRVIFELHARTRGWLGFGISPNGGMRGADMILGWVDAQGQPHLSDRHGTANAFPPADAHQDWHLVGGQRNDTHTILKFWRRRETCDEDDLPIGDDTMRLIWAVGEELPSGPDSFRPHSNRNRGSRSVYMTEDTGHITPQLAQELAAPDTLQLEFKGSDVAVPSDYHTLYWCQIFRLPAHRPHHLIKYEPWIQPGNEPYVHHMILYSCEDKLDMARFVDHPGPCFDARAETKEFSPMYSCTSKFLAGWAVGGEAHVFPEGVGYPFFTSDSDQFLMLETHYDNSALDQNILDSSGMVLHLTPRLRPMEAGTLTFGVTVDPMAMVIPPNQANFTQYAYCPSDCYDQLPPEGINVYSGLLHSHLAGRAMRVRHIRNGRELPPLIEDAHYDFNYQEMRTRKTPTRILPGDSFITECTFDTRDRQGATFGGFSTQEEMCLAFVEYWPRQQDASTFCMSQPEPKTMYGWLGADPSRVFANESVKEVEGVSSSKWIDDSVNWRAEAGKAAQELQRSVRDRLHVAFCMTPEAAEAQLDKEARSEGVAVPERPGHRRRQAERRMKFRMKPVNPARDFAGYRRYERPTRCLNRRSAPQRGNGEGRTTISKGFLATALLNLLRGFAGA